MADEDGIRTAFRQQARWCRELGSPFTAVLMDAAASGLDRDTALGRQVLDWAGKADSTFGALPLRFAGGLHALVRRGRLPKLAVLYPPHPLPDGTVLWDAVRDAMQDAGPELSTWLENPPQTNEVARSGPLMAGLMTVVAETGLPVSLFELGASAGLNLLLDRFSYQLGTVRAGAPDSAVRLAPEWRGPDPVRAEVHVVGRRGVDISPLDVSDPADRERLTAYIWADQAPRLERLDAALGLARADPPALDRADAADWVEQRLAVEPERGVARVLMHSIAHQYFPPEVQARIATHVDRIGRAATADGPFAWLRLEVDQQAGGSPLLSLTTWPGDRHRVLARASAHGIWVEWMGEA